MQLSEFSQFLQKVETTSSRNEITVITAEFLNKLRGEEIKPTMYLMQGRLVPKYIPIEFNMSSKLILRALEDLVENKETIKKLYHQVGDVGLVAEEVVRDRRLEVRDLGAEDRSLKLERVEEYRNVRIDTILEAHKALSEIAEAAGKGSQVGKMSKYKNMILNVDPLSARYLTRIITGTLRLGISDKTILDSISWTVKGDKSFRKDLDFAFGVRADVGQLAQMILENKTDAERKLEKIKVQPGTPLAAKLVEREISSEAVWKRMPECFVQPKLDGLRGQLHFDKKLKEDKAMIFSRNMESMTDQYPEIIKSLENLNVESIILDSEVIGYDEKRDKYLSYQDTMKRRRKYDVEAYSKDIPVRAMCFDVLYLNGEDLTKKPIEERLKILSKVLGSKSGSLVMLETKKVSSEEELEEYFKDKVENGLEGIITKEAKSIYEPGTRNFKWLKLKANTRSDLVDTIDVAILGYFIGKGDRSRFGFGALLAGVYDPEDGKYYSVGKVGSGFKEDEMPKILEDMQKLKTKENKRPENVIVEKTLYPDTWIEPRIIIEIDADEITRSPNHTAARGIKADVKIDDSTKGLSVRFPRLKIWMRDKEFPNTVQELVRMYELRMESKSRGQGQKIAN